MLVTRKLDEDLVKWALQQKEAELTEADKEVDKALVAYESALNKRDVVLKHVEQLRGTGEVDEELGVDELGQDGNSLTNGTTPTGGLFDSEGGQWSTSNSVVYFRFWKKPKFNWRTYIPEHIEETNKLLSLEDIFKSIEAKYYDLTNEEKKTLKSTISGSLSILRAKNILRGYFFPGKQGAFYGPIGFFEYPDLEIAKQEYIEELSERLNLPIPEAQTDEASFDSSAALTKEEGAGENLDSIGLEAYDEYLEQ